jgi:uncharacterized cupredoxin-like copper-binding protein
MKRIPIVAILALGLLLVLAACSTRSVTLNVLATDSGYDSKVYTVPAGAKVTLHLTNNGSTEHEFAILNLGQEVSLPFSDDDEGKIYWELDGVPAGETKTGTFTAPTEPGEYSVVCGLPGHIEQGMTATLVVK